MNAHEVIKQPVITEKTTLLQEKKIYAFWVNSKATKIDIKIAIKAIYGANVAQVKIVNIAEKIRTVRKGSFNKRKFNRKAYITLVGKANLDTSKFEKTDKETKVKLMDSVKVKKTSVKKDVEKKTTKAKKTN